MYIICIYSRFCLTVSTSLLFRNWGTHIIQEIYVGAEIEFYATKDSSSSLTSKDIQVSLCAGYSGVGAHIDGCAGASSSDIDKKVASDTTKSIFTLGGTESGAKARLSGDGANGMAPNASDVIDFLQTASEAAVASGHKLTPIWEVMTARSNTPSDIMKSALFMKLALETSFFDQGDC